MSEWKGLSNKMYIIVNTTLKMGKGKISAQVGHGVANVIRFMERQRSKDKAYQTWEKEFHGKIVLQATQEQMEQLAKTFPLITGKETIFCIPVFDAGKTQISSGSLTVLTFNPVAAGETPEELQKLKLL
jgi:PTH2 family peptidyl-tRNA hydrolase